MDLTKKDKAKKQRIQIPGESGSYLYVAAEGEYDVIKDGKVLGR